MAVRRGYWWGVLGLLVSAAATAQSLRIEAGHAREMPPGQSNSAAFFTLVNTADTPVVLVAAACDCASRAEIHTHRHQGGMMRMEKVDRLEVPARGRLVLKPGGYHLMLLDLKRPLRTGERVGVTLIGEGGESFSAELPVQGLVPPRPTQSGQDHQHHAH